MNKPDERQIYRIADYVEVQTTEIVCTLSQSTWFRALQEC